MMQRIKNKVVLVDFTAAWCGPCRAMKPLLESLALKYGSKLDVVEIDIDAHKKLATQFMVQSIPTLILFRDGEEIKRFVGLQNESAISPHIDEAIGQAAGHLG